MQTKNLVHDNDSSSPVSRTMAIAFVASALWSASAIASADSPSPTSNQSSTTEVSPSSDTPIAETSKNSASTSTSDSSTPATDTPSAPEAPKVDDKGKDGTSKEEQKSPETPVTPPASDTPSAPEAPKVDDKGKDGTSKEEQKSPETPVTPPASDTPSAPEAPKVDDKGKDGTSKEEQKSPETPVTPPADSNAEQGKDKGKPDTGVVTEKPKPAVEVPKQNNDTVDSGTVLQPQESSTPTITPSVEEPVVTDQGYKIVDVSKSTLTLENADGTHVKVQPELIGGVTNGDGTVTIKNSKGGLETLPETGVVESMLLTLLGYLLLIFGFKLLYKNKVEQPTYTYL